MNLYNRPYMDHWLATITSLTTPKAVYICNGSDEEYKKFCQQMVDEGRMIKLNENIYDNCYLCRSDPNDVARTENCTFICTNEKRDAGPTNNWMNPTDMKNKLNELYKGCMTGRTMYVIPFCMGNPKSDISQVGCQITDSLYVAISMRIMTRIIDIDEICKRKYFVKCLHSVGYPVSDSRPDVIWPCNNANKYICHFPETLEICSYGSGYGGNALLGKKCLALRIASWLGKKEGWLAEHMLISKITNLAGKYIFITAAFPSSCGKTNLAMLQSILPGWKVECIGDDIAWMKVKNGRLYALNPEFGMFGVLPGTSHRTNPVVMQMIKRNTIFTNVGLTPDRDVWWEGIGKLLPSGTISWLGEVYDGTKQIQIANANSRFTAPITECPVLAPEFNDPEGVPVSAVLFGGRRKDTIPLCLEAQNWKQGVIFGASLSSETTSAATGQVGILRHDPFSMLPFVGYNICDYFDHWLKIGERITNTKLFLVNWFRKDSMGKYLWPGFGYNIYVLKWIFNRCIGENVAFKTCESGLISEFTKEEINEIYGQNTPEEIDDIFKFDNIDQIREYNRMTKYFDSLDGNVTTKLLN